MDDNGTRVSINLEAKTLDDIELNKLDFNKVGIQDTDGKYKTLKEIGAEFIKSISTKYGTQFIITLANNNTLTSKELYNINFINNTLNDKDFKIDEIEKLYQRVDKVV